MAIKITNEIITDRGLTNELYINIASVEYSKNIGDMVISINKYKNQTDRQEDKKCRTFDIAKVIVSKFEMSEVIDDNTFVVAYNKLKEYFNEYTIENV